MEYIINTDRLFLRKISKDDFNELCEILKDEKTMYAWEAGFSDIEVSQWIEKNIIRYKNEGFSYFGVIEKHSQKLIGVAGPLIENVDGNEFIGIAYIFNRKYWKMGYAIEAAKSCLDYAFTVLKAEKVIAEIRPENISSRAIAEKLGMTIEGEFTKIYKDKDMLHLIYSCKKR